MKDKEKIKQQLTDGLTELRIRIAALEEEKTKRKWAEEELHKISQVIKYSPSIVMITDSRGNIEFINPKFSQISGYSAKEIIGTSASELGKQSSEVQKQMWDTISSGNEWRGEFLNKKKNGELYWESASISSIKNQKGIITHFVKVAEDITERKQIEEELTKRHKQVEKLVEERTIKLRKVNEQLAKEITNRKKVEEAVKNRLAIERLTSKIMSYFISLTSKEIDKGINNTLKNIAKFFNAKRSSLFLFSEDLTQMTNTHEWCASASDSQIALLQGIPSETFGHYWNLLQRLETVSVSGPDDLPLDAHGERKWIKKHGFRPLLFVPMLLGGKLFGTLGFYGKINEEQEWPNEFVELLKFVADFLVNILERKRTYEELQKSEEKYSNLFHHSNDAIIIHDLEGNIIDVNQRMLDHFGYTSSNILSLRISDIHPPEMQEISRRAFEKIMRDGFVNFEIDFKKKTGEVFSANVSSSLFEIGDKKVIQGIIRDITERKKAEEELRESFKKVQKTLEGTVRALALTAELRDPYTAGHQQRVAQLAIAIAKEMGLSEEKIKGIQTAGVIHDIGKIYVPAEILSKPGKLNEEEFKLIKKHPQIGYEIFKTIEFPWPIAQIVFQHHERMDGSGYPQGCSDKDILLEARILAVSDVVEAMASHRPYRPALGIDKALGEIKKNRGTLYDSKVADACLKLFVEKGFKFE